MSDKIVSRGRVIDRWEQAAKLMPKTIMGVHGQLYLTPTPENMYGDKDFFYTYGPGGSSAEFKTFLYLEGHVTTELSISTETPMTVIELGLDAKLIASLWAQTYASLPKDD